MKSAEAVAKDFYTRAEDKKPKAVLFFASSNYDPASLGIEMKKAFSSASVFGCTTAGEIVSGKMVSGSVVAMIIGSDIVEDICVGMARNIAVENQIPKVFGDFKRHLKTPVAELDISSYVGIILIDGMSGAEEKLMESVGDLTNITFIGGSAGDDLKFKETFIFADGKASSNAAVLALFKLKKGFDIIKTQSFRTTNKKLRATSVDEATRLVAAFDNVPATKAYAAALGCSEEEAAKKFMSNPLGLMVGAEPYIRSPQRFDSAGMVFYCNIKEGMELEVMESTEIVKDTAEAVRRKCNELGTVSGIVDFHCILRTLELRQKNQCDAYGAIFKDIPMIGFSTYGEEYIGHINQTSTMLVFK